MEHFSTAVDSFIDLLDIQKNIEESINNLSKSNFSDKEIVLFEKVIGEYLSSSKSTFAISVLFDQAKELSKIINKKDNETLSNFRKIIKVILSIGNEKILSYFETNIIKKNNCAHFFILLEETILCQKDTSRLEDTFIRLIPINNFSYVTIENFLKILSKDKLWLIHKLLHWDLIQSVVFQINETSFYEKIKLKEVAHALASYKIYSNATQYARLMICMLQNTNEFVDVMLQQTQISSSILEATIIAEQRSVSISNYSHYLYNKNKDSFYKFENKIIESNNIKAPILLEYVCNVSFSSKRLILKKLVSMHAEQELVKFIKSFPEYQNLLPML